MVLRSARDSGRGEMRGAGESESFGRVGPTGAASESPGGDSLERPAELGLLGWGGSSESQSDDPGPGQSPGLRAAQSGVQVQ